jgi:hypothetical protein
LYTNNNARDLRKNKELLSLHYTVSINNVKKSTYLEDKLAGEHLSMFINEEMYKISVGNKMFFRMEEA